MSSDMEDTRKLHDKVSGGVPQGNNAYVVDPAEWEDMKQKLARIDRKSRVAACFAWIWSALFTGIVQRPCRAIRRVCVGCATMCRTIATGTRCVVKALIFSVLWMLKTVAQSAIAVPTLIRRVNEYFESIDAYLFFPRSCALWVCAGVHCAIFGYLAPHFGIPWLYVFVPIVFMNLMSLAYEIGRAKEMDAEKEVKNFKEARREMAQADLQKIAAVSAVFAPKPQVTDRIARLMAQAQNNMEALPLTLTNTSLAQLLQEGKYDHPLNPEITDVHFPASASGNGATTALLLGFNEDVTTAEVEAVAQALGLRLGNSRDGAHLGVQHPDCQRTNHLVCLGDSWHDFGEYPYIVALYSRAGSRLLHLNYRTDGWYDGYRFLAFRK